jgi:hypothetical protein
MALWQKECSDTDINPNDNVSIARRITAILVWELRSPTRVFDHGTVITAWSREFRSDRLPLGELRLPDGRIITVSDERHAHMLLAEGRRILGRDGATMAPNTRRKYERALATLKRFIKPRERGPRVRGRNPTWPVSGDPERLLAVYDRLVALLRRRDRSRPLPDVWGASPEGFAGMAPAEIARHLIAWARGLTPTSGHEAVKRLIRQARRLSARLRPVA